VDQDYVSTLAPEHKEWLAQFNDRFYGADFRGPAVHEWSTDERREVYRAKNAANRDLMTCEAPTHGVDVPEETVEFEEMSVADDGPLDDARYKAAREAYREDPSPANRVRLHQARRK
jgi:hypothetical protein